MKKNNKNITKVRAVERGGFRILHMYAVLLFIVIIGIISMPFMKVFHKIDFLRIAPLFFWAYRNIFCIFKVYSGQDFEITE